MVFSIGFCSFSGSMQVWIERRETHEFCGFFIFAKHAKECRQVLVDIVVYLYRADRLREQNMSCTPEHFDISPVGRDAAENLFPLIIFPAILINWTFITCHLPLIPMNKILVLNILAVGNGDVFS